MKSIILLISVLPALAFASVQHADGLYVCDLEIEEYYETHINEGEAFPVIGERFLNPKKATSSVYIKFEDEKAKVLSAEKSLPNWMLLNKSNSVNFTSTAQVNKESITYMIDWDNWYYGVSMRIESLSKKPGMKLKVNISLDDHDGISQDYNNVSCDKLVMVK